MGNIFDLVVFRPFENRTTTTANLTLWNRARHDELVEQQDRQMYRNTVVYAKGSHEPFQAGKPIYITYRVPQTADRIHARDAYVEPQQGPHGPILTAYTERRRIPQQRVHVQVTTVTTRRMHIELMRIVAAHDTASRQVDRTPVHNRLRYKPFQQTSTTPLSQPHTATAEKPNPETEAAEAIKAIAEAPDAEENWDI